MFCCAAELQTGFIGAGLRRFGIVPHLLNNFAQLANFVGGQ
jgi:hypothetical protein